MGEDRTRVTANSGTPKAFGRFPVRPRCIIGGPAHRSLLQAPRDEQRDVQAMPTMAEDNPVRRTAYLTRRKDTAHGAVSCNGTLAESVSEHPSRAEKYLIARPQGMALGVNSPTPKGGSGGRSGGARRSKGPASAHLWGSLVTCLQVRRTAPPAYRRGAPRWTGCWRRGTAENQTSVTHRQVQPSGLTLS